ncbi:MAG: RcnB family protein [Solobacterium sp.]|nr:RcnB family protein [Solobacterium sp.]
MRERKRSCIAALALLAVLAAGCTGTQGTVSEKAEFTVGEDIRKGDITEFYYTYDSSAFPPEYRRYRFYTEDWKYYFYHEKREGEEWPLTEKHITVSGTVNMAEDGWDGFFGYLEGGTVVECGENLDSGDAGPWLYLYWKNDGGEYREFAFPSRQALASFEEYCEKMKGE